MSATVVIRGWRLPDSMWDTVAWEIPARSGQVHGAEPGAPDSFPIVR